MQSQTWTGVAPVTRLMNAKKALKRNDLRPHWGDLLRRDRTGQGEVISLHFSG